jgi:hypothetical protein
MSRFRRYIDGYSKLYLCPYTSYKFSRGKGLGTKEALSIYKKRVIALFNSTIVYLIVKKPLEEGYLIKIVFKII